MGYYSWLKADSMTEVVNIASGLPFKCLIPKEFDNTNKGYIEDIYRDYGFLLDPTKEQMENPLIPDWNRRGRYDMYELLAVWNKDYVTDTEIEVNKVKYPSDTRIGDILKGVPEDNFMKEIDENTDFNHEIGVAIGCTDRDKEKLLYPLKLVSPNYKRTYEQCMGISYSDPAQGCRSLRTALYKGSFGSDCRYDGMKWESMYSAWKIAEEMRFGKSVIKE